MIKIKIPHATERYALSSLGRVFLYWYSKDAITSLEISSEAAITITAKAAPANSLLKPLTE